MAVSLAPHGIRANAIAPGFVGTTLLDEGLAEVSEAEAEAFRNEIEERTLLGRLAEPEEMKSNGGVPRFTGLVVCDWSDDGDRRWVARPIIGRLVSDCTHGLRTELRRIVTRW